jgi:hypothetical protein
MTDLYRVVCIFLLTLATFLGLSVVGLAFENITMRRELVKCYGGAK